MIQSAVFSQYLGSESGMVVVLVQVKTLRRWESLARSSAAAYKYSPLAYVSVFLQLFYSVIDTLKNNNNFYPL